MGGAGIFSATSAATPVPGRGRGPGLLRVGAVLAVLLALALAWTATPLRGWLDPARIAGLAEPLLGGGPAGFVLVGGAYLVLSLAMVPLKVLSLTTVLVFGPRWGFVYALTAALMSATTAFGLGRLLGRGLVDRIGGGRIQLLARRLAVRGVLAVTALRLVPLAPFTVVNLAAGASPLRFRVFLAATFLALLPGTLVNALLADRLIEAVREPGIASLGLLLVLLAAAGTAAVWIRRRAGASAGRAAAPDPA